MWEPSQFGAYRTLYPETPDLSLPDTSATDSFERAWRFDDTDLDRRVQQALAGVSVVFVRGYLGNWMPGNLVGPRRGLQALGIDARIASNRANANVDTNAASLVHQLEHLPGALLLCGHSKGGLECLWALDRSPALRERTLGVILSQTPRGPSGVLESLLTGAHQDTLPGWSRWAEEWMQRLGLYAIRADHGGRQLTTGPLDDVIATLDARDWSLPVWQTASWSSRPTTWLDSFHGRLEEIRPGCAHDGQFFLEDLFWPDIPHVLLAHVDHAQPVMGGFGFDEARYWKAVIACFCAAIAS